MSEENLEGLDAPENLDLETPDSAGSGYAESSDEPIKAHPAHEKILSELPEAWHQKVLPHLQEQDRYFQQQLEKYTPYKQFVEDGVDPNFLVQSVQLAQAIANDPVTVHGNLTQALMQQGLLREDAEQAAQEIIDENSELYEEEDLPENIRRQLEARDAELDAIKQQLSSQEFEKATQQELANLEYEFSELTSSYEISPQQERAILELLDAAVLRGEDMTVYQAARKLVEITGVGFKKIGQQDLSSPAPTVLGGSGGNGIPFEGVEIPSDPKQKKEMLAQLFKNNLGQN